MDKDMVTGTCSALGGTSLGATTSVVVCDGVYGVDLLEGIVEAIPMTTGVTVGVPLLSSVLGSTSSAEPEANPAIIIVEGASGGSLNVKACDKVEMNAKKIHDKYDDNHQIEMNTNAAIIATNYETSKEVNDLLKNGDKETLLNELEALKEYNNSKKLTLK